MPLNGQFLDKSGLTYLWSKLKTKFAAKQDTIADLSEIRSGAAAGATAVQQTVFTTDQDRQEVEIGVVANAGAKNLFKIREPLTNTRNNVTFVVNADGTVDVSTTSDGASAQTDLTIGTVDTYEGVTYKLTGCPSGVTGLCACGTGGTGSVIDTGSDALLTPTTSGSRSPFVRVFNGAVITTPVKFYPMICRAEITDSTYVPYAPTNRELYETKTEQTETNVIANAGAKNLLKITSATQTINGVTFTVNDDQTITINGTSQERAQFYLRQITVYPGMQGCILNGAVHNDQNVTLRFQLGSNPWTTYANDSGSGAVIQSYNDNSIIQVYINVPGGITVSNLIFKPMIRPASITDDTFVPYAPTNRELYETKANTSELHEILPNITSSTTIQDYVNALSKGVYTAFIANVSNPSDSPINANCFVNIYVYSTNTAAVELIPIATGELARTYTMRKISGTWRKWYMVEGTVVS